MGYPAFYWYPVAGGTLEILSLEDRLQDLNAVQTVEREDSVGWNGVQFGALQQEALEVRIVWERFGSSSPGSNNKERRLQSMMNHLLRGMPVGFTRDTDKCVAYKLASSPSRGATTGTLTTRQLFYAWNTSAALAADDEIVLESAAREAKREWKTVDGIAGSTLTYDDTVFNTFTGTTFIRYRDFWPCLFLPRQEADVESHQRRSWTLDLTLRYSTGSLNRLARAANVEVNGELDLEDTTPTVGKRTLQELLE